MKVGPKNQRKKEREKRKGKHMSSFWTLKPAAINLLCPHFGLQTSTAERDSSLPRISVHLNKFLKNSLL